MSAKPKSWREVLPLVQALYARHSAGCCWHVVLDDQNVADTFVRACAETVDPKHADCVALIEPLLASSITQRAKLAGNDKRKPMSCPHARTKTVELCDDATEETCLECGAKRQSFVL